MASKYQASSEFITWAQSLGGMLTKIRSQYRSASSMLEHASWDEGKTEYAVALVSGLHAEIAAIHKEMSSHVVQKFGKDH